ncbi:MAG: PfkB family carbohydrate kinase [Planctomycetota bacterium]|jgi:rfaE bifunctional protein kinase chain/domain|nr:PfkB family carbohydrate kinase [Planctomycetota bacterium]
MAESSELSDLLAAIAKLRVAVYGDFALDVYWDLAEDGEHSLETGLAVRLVARERCSPGGAGNVAANLAALGAAEVRAVGPVGDDAFGRRLREDLAGRGVNVGGLEPPHPSWRTPAYAKPMANGRETQRFDFGTRQGLEEEHLDILAARLAEATDGCDAVALNQQIEPGALPPPMARRLAELAAGRSGTRFLVDTRRDMSELAALPRQRNAASLGTGLDAAGIEARARQIAGTATLFITLGAGGILVVDGPNTTHVPAVMVEGPIDPVGAGDATAAALAAAGAAGASAVEAARLASLAAAVTVGKLGRTGTASPAEVLELAERTA